MIAYDIINRGARSETISPKMLVEVLTYAGYFVGFPYCGVVLC